MKIISAPSRRKLKAALAVMAAAVCVILLAGIIGRSADKGPKGRTNEERIKYIASLGWEAQSIPTDEKQILLPEAFPEVLLQYNESQLAAGFDLTRYAGKTVTMYTYKLMNYPVQGEVLCTLYTFRGKIIGGDIHSTSFTGFMKALHSSDGVK